MNGLEHRAAGRDGAFRDEGNMLSPAEEQTSQKTWRQEMDEMEPKSEPEQHEELPLQGGDEEAGGERWRWGGSALGWAPAFLKSDWGFISTQTPFPINWV